MEGRRVEATDHRIQIRRRKAQQAQEPADAETHRKVDGSQPHEHELNLIYFFVVITQIS